PQARLHAFTFLLFFSLGFSLSALSPQINSVSASRIASRKSGDTVAWPLLSSSTVVVTKDQPRFPRRRSCLGVGRRITWRRFPFLSPTWASSLSSTSTQLADFDIVLSIAKTGEEIRPQGPAPAVLHRRARAHGRSARHPPPCLRRGEGRQAAQAL